MRLSLNQRTDQAVVAARGRRPGASGTASRAIGLWREPVAETGLARSRASWSRDAGLRVSSLCRGGFFTALPDDDGARRAALDDNRRAIDEAAELGAACLVHGRRRPAGVAGEPLPAISRDLAAPGGGSPTRSPSWRRTPGERGVRLALEPLHPMYCRRPGVLSTLGQALDLAEPYPRAQVGVVVDTFHVWWDPRPARADRPGGRPDRLLPGVRLAAPAARRTCCSAGA